MALDNIFGRADKKKEIPQIEEWTWIEGYKGTNADMTCNGYQYRFHCPHEMPEDANIEVCESGFHFCKELRNVFGYYPIGQGNRFFKVKALVRTADVAKGGSGSIYHGFAMFDSDKYVAKSIIFYYELSPEEVFAGNAMVKGWSTEEKLLAMKTSIDYVKKERERSALASCGYSQAFTEWVVQNDKFDVAYAVGSQKDLSMDMKVLTILQDKGKKLDLLNKQFVISTAGLDRNDALNMQIKAYQDQLYQSAMAAIAPSVYPIAGDGKED